jgi:hypothetical protein
MNPTFGGVYRAATRSNHGTEVKGAHFNFERRVLTLSLVTECVFAGSLLLTILTK